ncbi:DUF5343 domain-containing protein [Xanthomonas campestris]|uniref:DUF5343 domain-containing protein n=2 Tax=Xanthomonas campestris TaxID=339 RepID=UPI001F2A5AA3|nr:DUF5343 domain-containing protein [Xanthomonas campestris]MCF8795256.1 DUF5343 domain-containing protein [Xanthomonas campestris pv. campestris]WHO89007.1 DUF5343 domain-containing protein [Xanthomonas campestris]
MKGVFQGRLITSDTVKRLGLAPNNESYVINVLQFVGIIDSEGKKTPDAAKAFSHHKDEEFSKSFSVLVQKAYHALFELHGGDAWKLSNDDLITFFRQSDQTSATIGGRQANTFKVLAGLAGYGDLPEAKKKGVGKKAGKEPPKPAKSKAAPSRASVNASTGVGGIPDSSGKNDLGLTVRVEINLPADGTKETYDAIFKSIKENLLSG